MQRRAFLISAATLVAVPQLGLAADPAPERVFYSPGVVETALAEGKVVFLDFWASWCSTCAAQDRVMAALKAQNPAYAQKVTFITVDWDDYGRAPIARDLNIPRRSTLVALQGDTELGRIVAGTARDDIKALMDKALNAAR
ncbi:Thioredoxin [Aquimixticola soesokkakensis]|uniref:Thioredoxin n=1 Tax=Aquimixticola soesokkakensis TaxID=1519096 RepID=A0A1Y5TIF5_9RHOB|nr:thioredoxin family protein [Aquimixticola soesokkakensis]SLN62704.1 Thioredoxin [Aquimixticola soesokkakensis]